MLFVSLFSLGFESRSKGTAFFPIIRYPSASNYVLFVRFMQKQGSISKKKIIFAANFGNNESRHKRI
jgi:hypothetical protein